MNTVVIDGRRCKTRELTHAYLAKKPIVPPYYGRNLDALYDALTSCDSVHIRVRYPKSIEANLGQYGEKLLTVFRDAARANGNITLEIK